MIRVFGLTALITIALTVRSQHMIESAAVWWTNFLPVVAYSVLWKGKRIFRLEHLLCFSVFVYFVFHSFHFWFSSSTLAEGVEFWPASLMSVLIVTFFVFKEVQKCRQQSAPVE